MTTQIQGQMGIPVSICGSNIKSWQGQLVPFCDVITLGPQHTVVTSRFEAALRSMKYNTTSNVTIYQKFNLDFLWCSVLWLCCFNFFLSHECVDIGWSLPKFSVILTKNSNKMRRASKRRASASSKPLPQPERKRLSHGCSMCTNVCKHQTQHNFL